MTPKSISTRVVADRLDVVDLSLREIRALPLGNRDTFFSDRRNIWTAESCLRRSLEEMSLQMASEMVRSAGPSLATHSVRGG